MPRSKVSKEIYNKQRRDYYAANKDEINKRRRELYAEKKKLSKRVELKSNESGPNDCTSKEKENSIHVHSNHPFEGTLTRSLIHSDSFGSYVEELIEGTSDSRPNQASRSYAAHYGPVSQQLNMQDTSDVNVDDQLIENILWNLLKKNQQYEGDLGGQFMGKHVFIPRIPLEPNPTDNKYSIPFVRRQIPVRLCFAMTINKSQGQTLDYVGVYLRQPVFTHGQLYVALSRAKTGNNIKVLIIPATWKDLATKYTANVVYSEILDKAKPT